MKTKVLETPKSPATNKKDVDSSFEEDWRNGITGEEFLRQVHEHIRKLYASRPKK